MSHDEKADLMTRTERRAARNGKRQAAPRHVWAAENYVRTTWSLEEVIRMLESRARGYNSLFREILCTAAAMLTEAQEEDLLKEKVLAGYRTNAISEMADEAVAAPIVPKRNQQPGRLSGGEREALKKFVALVAEAETSDEEVMAAGRALLTKVRKRALEAVPVSATDKMVKEQVVDEMTIEATAHQRFPSDSQGEESEAAQVARRITMAAGNPL